MSSLKRIATAQSPNGSSNRLNNTNNQNNNNNQNNGRPRSPFGSRNNQDNTPEDPNTYVNPVLTPTHNTMVRFALLGLGDPFYRVLGAPMNPEMGEVNPLVAALAEGSAQVDELVQRLNTAWEGYALRGAMLVYPYQSKVVEALANPVPMPVDFGGDFDFDDDDDEQEKKPTTKITRLRATDPTLTLNVLARARSQVLLADAPIVFGQEYMTRHLLTDDPRLVAIARATGCLPDA